MKELNDFVTCIKHIMESRPTLDIDSAREIVRTINDFLYTTHDGIGSVNVLGQTFEYFSEFHKFWHENYIDILDCKITTTYVGGLPMRCMTFISLRKERRSQKSGILVD